MQPAIRSTTASAPGKVILCGEHAVVYGQPAIALPLSDLRAMATIDDSGDDSITIALPDLGEMWRIHDSPDHPLATLMRLTLDRIGESGRRGLHVTLRSAIPIASGMGSGAALGAALARALVSHLGAAMSHEEIAALVYESERFYHGTPSGIDNTVVSHERAIWFVRGDASFDPPRPPLIEPLTIGRPFRLVIGDTGVRAPTHLTVGGVRERWLCDPQRYESLFASIGAISHEARMLLAAGAIPELGATLDRNQALLEAIGVSSSELERLIDAARSAGALGAKLSGGGGGGIMLAIVHESHADAVKAALRAAGAPQVVETVVG
jgi:mevalonate kinase